MFYRAATLTNFMDDRDVDALDSVDISDKHTPPALFCLVEQLSGGMGVDERVQFAVVTITPSTGDVVWDEFDGNSLNL